MEDAPSAHTRLRMKCCAESLPSPSKSPRENRKLPLRSDRVLRGSRQSPLLKDVDDKSLVNNPVQNGKSEASTKRNGTIPEKKATRSSPTNAKCYLGEDSPKTPRRYKLSLSENRPNTRRACVSKSSLLNKSSEKQVESRRSLRIRSSEGKTQNKSLSEKRKASRTSDSESDSFEDIPLKKHPSYSTTESSRITLRKNESTAMLDGNTSSGLPEKSEVCADKGAVSDEVVPMGGDKKEAISSSPSDTLSTSHQELSHLSTQSPPSGGENSLQDSTASNLFQGTCSPSTSGTQSPKKITSVAIVLEPLSSGSTSATSRASPQCVGTRRSLRLISHKRAPQVDSLTSGDSSDDTFEEIEEGSRTSLHRKHEKFVTENVDDGDNASDSFNHELVFSDDTNNNQEVRSLEENKLCTNKKVGEEYSSLEHEFRTYNASECENDLQFHVTDAENSILQKLSFPSSSSEHSGDEVCKTISGKDIVSSGRGQSDGEITGDARGFELQSLKTVDNSTVNLSSNKGLVAGDDRQHAENPELSPDSSNESESNSRLSSAGDARSQNVVGNEQESNNGSCSHMESAAQHKEENMIGKNCRSDVARGVSAMDIVDIIVLDSDASSEFSIFEVDASKVREIVQDEKSESMETDIVEVRSVGQGDDSESTESEKETDEAEDEKEKDEAEDEKEKDEAEDEKEKDETEDKKERDEIEDVKGKDETVNGEQKNEIEDEKGKAETEDGRKGYEAEDDDIEVIEVNLVNKQKTGQDGPRNKKVEKKHANKHEVDSLQREMSLTSGNREEHLKNKLCGRNAPTRKVSSDLCSVNSLKSGIPASLNTNTSANSLGEGHGFNKDDSMSQKTQFSTQWYLNSSVAMYKSVNVDPKQILSPGLNSESLCEGCSKVYNDAKESLNAATKPKKSSAVAAAKLPNSNFNGGTFYSKKFVDSNTVLNVPEKYGNRAEANCKPSKSSSSTQSVPKFADAKSHFLGTHRSVQTEGENVGKGFEPTPDAEPRKKVRKKAKARIGEGTAEPTGSDFKRASKEDDDPAISPGGVDFVASRTSAQHSRQQERQRAKKLRRKRLALLKLQQQEKLKKPAVSNDNAFGSSLGSSARIQERSDATPRIRDVVLCSTKLTKKERMSDGLHHITRKKRKKKKSLGQNASAETFKCQATTQWTVEDVSRGSSKLRRLPEAVINQLGKQQSRRLLHKVGKIGKVRQKHTKRKHVKNAGLAEDDFRVTTDTDFIPLKTGTTVQFGVMPLDKMTKAASALAKVPADFRRSMLYGSHIRREPVMSCSKGKKREVTTHQRQHDIANLAESLYSLIRRGEMKPCNVSERVAEMLKLSKRTVLRWSKCVDHVEKIIEEDWQIEVHQDIQNMAPFIIPLGSDLDTTDEDAGGDDGDILAVTLAKTLLDNHQKLKASRKDGLVQFARL